MVAVGHRVAGRGPGQQPAHVLPCAARTFSVDENTAAGENIGAPVTATDTDRDNLAYSLEGDGRGVVLHRPGDRADTDQCAAEPRGEGQPLRDGEG